MNSKNIKLGYFCVAFIIATSCSSAKNINSPIPLYKTDKGKEIAYKSYDNALKLFDVNFSEDYVETEYGKTHVLISGKDEGKPLFILPGLFGDASMWYPNVGELSKHFKVYTIDMPNYGGKSQPSSKTIEEFNDYKNWFNQLLNNYKYDKVAALGVSYSSWLILALSREIPESFSSIILLDPSETFMPMNGGIAWKGFKSFMFFPNRNKYADFLDWLGGGYTNPDLLAWREHILDVIEYGSTKMFDVPQHRIYKPEELSMLTMPVLIIAGGKPILYDDPQQFKENAENAIHHAKVVIVPDAGHGLNMEKPELVNKEIVDFLNIE